MRRENELSLKSTGIPYDSLQQILGQAKYTYEWKRHPLKTVLAYLLVSWKEIMLKYRKQ